MAADGNKSWGNDMMDRLLRDLRKRRLSLNRNDEGTANATSAAIPRHIHTSASPVPRAAAVPDYVKFTYGRVRLGLESGESGRV